MIKPFPQLKLLLSLLLAISFVLSGCVQTKDPLIVYSGKGMKKAMDEIVRLYEKLHGVKVSIIYAGSNTLLGTIEETGVGDIFLPGSRSYIKKAGTLIANSYYVAKHVPTFAVRKDNKKGLKNYADLIEDGVQIAIANKEMAAIGNVAKAIMNGGSEEKSFRKNIAIVGSTVNEILSLVVDREVDAALVWTDMLTWEAAAGLVEITIPETVNKPKEIWIAELSDSSRPEEAKAFAKFVVSEQGQAIFKMYGFGI
ncbi:molybdate ABC transporter substrate-binding protein [Solemya velum gill symbiont]|nr:molybdate ABC transporter substrate-binding protein [Solemya velum gill symbiont]